MSIHYKPTRHVENAALNEMAGCNLFGAVRRIEFLLSLGLSEAALREAKSLLRAVEPFKSGWCDDRLSWHAATYVTGRIECVVRLLGSADADAAMHELRWFERFVGVPQREADPNLRRIRRIIEESRGIPSARGRRSDRSGRRG